VLADFGKDEFARALKDVQFPRNLPDAQHAMVIMRQKGVQGSKKSRDTGRIPWTKTRSKAKGDARVVAQKDLISDYALPFEGFGSKKSSVERLRMSGANNNHEVNLEVAISDRANVDHVLFL
jgi:hypothetical protein